MSGQYIVNVHGIPCQTKHNLMYQLKNKLGVLVTDDILWKQSCFSYTNSSSPHILYQKLIDAISYNCKNDNPQGVKSTCNHDLIFVFAKAILTEELYTSLANLHQHLQKKYHDYPQLHLYLDIPFKTLRQEYVNCSIPFYNSISGKAINKLIEYQQTMYNHNSEGAFLIDSNQPNLIPTVFNQIERKAKNKTLQLV